MTGGSMILVCAAACRQRIAGNNSIFSRQMPGSRTLWRVRQAKHNSMLRLWLAIVTSNRINPRCVIKARSPLLGGSLNSRDEKDDNVSRRDPSEIICDFNCSKFNRNSWNSSRRYVIYNITLLLLKIFLKFNILFYFKKFFEEFKYRRELDKYFSSKTLLLHCFDRTNRLSTFYKLAFIHASLLSTRFH